MFDLRKIYKERLREASLTIDTLSRQKQEADTQNTERDKTIRSYETHTSELEKTLRSLREKASQLAEKDR